jgi:serine/threonine protein phosphatase 1
MRIYAIGDIHGQLEMLRAAHARIDADRARCRDADATVVHLGDFVDRGPDSRGVIDFLIGGRDQGRPWVFVRGNHDVMFLDFLSPDRNPDDQLRAGLTWLDPRLGGGTTLASYGVTGGLLTGRRAIVTAARKAVPEQHVGFLSGLPRLYATPDVLFVHAGIRPGIPISQQSDTDLIWIREPFLSDTTDHGPLIVHGHTPVETPLHAGNRVDLDTGAGFGRPLTVAVFEGRDCWVLTDEGRVPLLPS